jgi:hypothetical protein
VHAKHGSIGDADPTISLALMFMVIIAGMVVVLGAQYLLQSKRKGQGTSWVRQLEDSRKHRVGHVQ